MTYSHHHLQQQPAEEICLSENFCFQNKTVIHSQTFVINAKQAMLEHRRGLPTSTCLMIFSSSGEHVVGSVPPGSPTSDADCASFSPDFDLTSSPSSWGLEEESPFSFAVSLGFCWGCSSGCWSLACSATSVDMVLKSAHLHVVRGI